MCQVSLDLGRGVDGASQVKGVCHHWLDRYLELGADKCDFSFDFIPGGGGACFSFELAWKGVLDAKWDIILNAVTLGGYGCATDSYDVITNDNASGWQLGEAVLECVGFALALGSLSGAFEGIGTLRGAFKRPIPAETQDLTGAFTEVSTEVARSRLWSRSSFEGARVYQRSDLIDPGLVDDIGRTNLQRMQSGLAPIGPDGMPINLHHMLQTSSSPIAEVTQTFHQVNGSVLHINPNSIPSGIDRSAFAAWRRAYWMSRACDFGGC